MPAIRRVVYNGPLSEVDVPSVGLYGVKPGVPVEVGQSAAEAVLTHPDFTDPDAKPSKADKATVPAADSTDSTAKEA